MCSVEMHARGVYVDDFDAQLHCVFDSSLLRTSVCRCVRVCVHPKCPPTECDTQ